MKPGLPRKAIVAALHILLWSAVAAVLCAVVLWQFGVVDLWWLR